jgi:hypothetical protein
MKKRDSGAIAALLACLCLAATAQAASSTSPSEITAIMSRGGLQKVKVKGVDLAYAAPGATLAGYSKVKLDPVQVAFSKDWNPKQPGTPFPMSKADRENTRKLIATTVYKAFSKELQQNNGYPIVSQAGPGVLGVLAYVIDVYVTVPTQLTQGQVISFNSSAGQGTLILQLYDSRTQKVLARVLDTQQANQSTVIKNSVTNYVQGEIIADRWAKELRRAFDRAHDIGKK